VNSLSAQLTSREFRGERGVSKAVPDGELAETVRFAIKATSELNLIGFKLGKAGVARLGAVLGHEVARNLLGGTRRSTYSKLESFCKKSGLGTFTLVQASPVVIRLKDRRESSASSKVDSLVTRTFKRSLLEAIFQDSLGSTVDVRESGHGAKGGTEWVIRPRTG
jgi:hypothetical protein